MKKSTRAFSSALVLLACLGLPATFTGCATAGDTLPVVTVEVLDAGHFRVGGKAADLGQLPRAVRRAGAGYHTEIRLLTPPAMPPKELDNAFVVLQQEGYLKVIQTHPREATVEIKQQTPSSPAKAPARAPSSTRPLKRK